MPVQLIIAHSILWACRPTYLLKRLMIVYNMSYLLDACQISAEKIKTTQTLRKKVREFTKSENLFEPYLKALASYTH